MTNREREYASLGFHYAEGIEQATSVLVPTTGRIINKIGESKWEAQPWNDDYYRKFDDLIEAIKFATPPRRALPKEI